MVHVSVRSINSFLMSTYQRGMWVLRCSACSVNLFLEFLLINDVINSRRLISFRHKDSLKLYNYLVVEDYSLEFE